MTIPHVLNEGKTAYHATTWSLGIVWRNSTRVNKAKKMRFIWASMYLARKYYSGTLFSWLQLETGQPFNVDIWAWREGQATCSAKGVPSFVSYFKTLSNGPALGIKPVTSTLLQSSPLLTELILLRHTTIVQTHVTYVPNCNNTSSFRNATYLQ